MGVYRLKRISNLSLIQRGSTNPICDTITEHKQRKSVRISQLILFLFKSKILAKTNSTIACYLCGHKTRSIRQTANNHRACVAKATVLVSHLKHRESHSTMWPLRQCICCSHVSWVYRMTFAVEIRTLFMHSRRAPGLVQSVSITCETNVRR